MEEVYLVTGASKGLGKAISELLVSDKRVVIALARGSDELLLVEKSLKSKNQNSMIIECDLSDKNSIFEACNIIKNRFTHLSGIVHNAGTIQPISKLLESNNQVWARAIMVNLIGVQCLTSNLSNVMGGHNHTRLVTISSGAALRPLTGWSSYCVSKAGLDMWTNCMAEEGAENNISAIAIAPGIVDTGMQAEIRNATLDQFPQRDNFIGYHENGDLVNPKEVAEKLLPFCTGILGENGHRYDVRNL